MLINREVQGKDGSFFVEINNQRLAEMTYSIEGKTLVVKHTGVSDELRGKNVGYQLVEHMVTYAKENGLKIKPLCSFVNSVFNKDKEKYIDVLV